ncbi:hypothetical protein [Phycicoccus sonneratiae]|uniref:Uncharacterized protein n=1 Tax=Phycicoccus sonneratiae TaxID=2807628 RepID=A0ABS2CK75_9MICO|nr:hypothetical protein [Phycicoccus sonneraticus]MBM6400180.1 hypothetical protein [Phycicoccus sonneraticus]
MRTVLSSVRSGLRRVGDLMNRLVADRPASRRPPGGNYIPNSNGEGGRVISSGHPGGH